MIIKKGLLMSNKLFFLVCLFLLSGCDEQVAAPAPKTEVSIITVVAKPITLKQTLTGRTKASLVSEVRPQVDGIIVEQLFKEGSKVEKGQLLYQIDPVSYQAVFNEAKANLENIQASLITAKNKYMRYQLLLEKQGVSKQDFDDVTATYKESLASVSKAEAALETARINLDRTKIKAQITGYIGISNVTVGALVTSSQSDALATIRNLDPIYVDVAQSSNQLLKLRKLLSQKNIQAGNAQVELKLEDDTTYEHLGQLQLQEVAVDESTGSVTLRAEFSNPDNILLPGMFVRTIVNDAVNEQAIMIPQRCVSRNSKGEPTVLVVNENNRVELKTITVGQDIGDEWYVTSGVNVGDHIIVEGINRVTTDEEVITVNYTPNTSAMNTAHIVTNNDNSEG